MNRNRTEEDFIPSVVAIGGPSHRNGLRATFDCAGVNFLPGCRLNNIDSVCRDDSEPVLPRLLP
jgi:hypothetical protein